MIPKVHELIVDDYMGILHRFKSQVQEPDLEDMLVKFDKFKLITFIICLNSKLAAELSNYQGDDFIVLSNLLLKTSEYVTSPAELVVNSNSLHEDFIQELSKAYEHFKKIK